MLKLQLDGHKLHLHHLRVRHVLNGAIIPLTIEMGPTSACNSNCTFCAFEYRKDVSKLSDETLTRFFTSIKDVDRKHWFGPESLHLAGDGEPTLHLQFKEIVLAAREANLQVGVTTNGTRILPLLQSVPGLTWCRFSINAGTEDTYQRIHRAPQTSLDQVFETVTNVGLANPHVTIGVQCLILGQSEPDLMALYERCSQSEVEYLAFKPYSPHPQAPHFLQCTAGRRVVNVQRESDPEHTPLVIVREEPPKKDYTGCLAAGTCFWLVCANGEVYPCAQFVGKEEWCMGDIRHQTYQEIAKSQKATGVVQALRDLDCRGCRHPCRCDAANRYLHRLLTPEPHDSFL
jgi:radical SAM protein with 4Fe4S-binding SPASM domain